MALSAENKYRLKFTLFTNGYPFCFHVVSKVMWRVENWILHCGSGLLEDGVGVGREPHHLAFGLELGELPAIVDRREGFPEQQRQQTNADDRENHAKEKIEA